METLETQLYFSQMLERIASEKRKREEDDEDVAMAEAQMATEEDDNGGDGGESFISEGTEFSFEFTNGVSIDLPTGEQMLSAEELFVDGKLKPLAKDGDDVMQMEASDLEPDYSKGDATVDIQRAWCSFSDVYMTRRSSDQSQKQNHLRISTIPGFRFDQNAGVVGTSFDDSLALASKHLKSFHESPRCVSMTVEGSRGHNRRSCVSLNSSRCSSPSRTFASSPSRTFAQPQTTPTSPKASVTASSSSSSHGKHSAFSSSKFLEFFKIKKHHSHIPHPNPNSRSFWPFSRSNSAGESKSLPVVLPPPRRSNSAGEGKTSSSSLLPAHKNGTGKHPMAIYSTQRQQQLQQQHHPLSKKGSASFPNKNVSGPLDCTKYDLLASQQTASSASLTKLASMPSMTHQLRNQPPSRRLASAISKSQPLQTAMSKSQPLQTPHRHASVGSIPSSSSPGSHKVGAVPRTHVNNIAGRRDVAEDQHSYPEYCPPSQSNRSIGSPRRQFRQTAAPNGTVNNFNRGSPGQQAPWSGPNRGNNLPRGTIRNVDRSNNKGLVRPKDMLNRDTTSIRVTPVLNVPACITPSSKSKLFNLGNIFSKKEKAVKGYTMLVPSDSQNGG